MTTFMSLSGAVASADSGVASHYGEPLPEQRSLDEGTAIVDLSHRGIVTVSGPDRLSWLNSMTSQQLVGLRPGESVETLLLDPNGRIEQAIRFVDDGDRAWLLVDEGAAEPLVKHLTRMRFALRVEIADVSDTHAVLLAFDGPAASWLAAQAPVVMWRDPWSATVGGGVQYARGDHAGRDWSAQQFVFTRAALDALAEQLSAQGLRPAGLMALSALEIRAWRPTQHGEVDARSIPHEFDWLRTAVHLTKGCYRGQETVAKVHNLGHPPRRLVLLHLDGSDGGLPVDGALVFRTDATGDAAMRPVGRVTRAALHYEWGGIALALVKRSVPEDAPLVVRGGATGADPEGEHRELVAATQDIVVPGDAGATRVIPRLKRL